MPDDPLAAIKAAAAALHSESGPPTASAVPTPSSSPTPADLSVPSVSLSNDDPLAAIKAAAANLHAAPDHTEPSIAQDAASGLASGLVSGIGAQTLGTPVDIASGVVNAVTGAGRDIAAKIAHPIETLTEPEKSVQRSKEIAQTPLIGNAPPGGSQWWNATLGAAGLPTTENVQPTTTLGKVLQQGTRAAGAFAAPGIAGKLATAADLPRVGEALSSLSPGSLPANAAIGAGAGAAGELAAEAAPDQYAPAARVAGETIGGIGGGLAGGVLGVGNLARNAMPPMTAASREAAAGNAAVRTLEGAASDPEAAFQNLQARVDADNLEKIPGAKPTTPEAATDSGMLALQRVRERQNDELGAAVTARDIASNKAQHGFLEGMAPKDTNAEPAQAALKQHLANIDTWGQVDLENARAAVAGAHAATGSALSDADQAARDQLEKASGSFGGTEALGTPEERAAAPQYIGAAMRDPAQAAYVAERQRLSALRDSIDPSGTMGIGPGPIKAAVSDIKNTFKPESGATYSGAENHLYNTADSWGNTIPIEDAFQFRANINGRLRQVPDHSPQEEKRLLMLKSGVDQAISDAVGETHAAEQAGTANPGVPPIENRISGLAENPEVGPSFAQDAARVYQANPAALRAARGDPTGRSILETAERARGSVPEGTVPAEGREGSDQNGGLRGGAGGEGVPQEPPPEYVARSVDTRYPPENPEDFNGFMRNAAYYNQEKGVIEGTHVTDRPDELQQSLKSATSLNRPGDEKYGELGNGFYISDSPQIWMGRSTGKWAFLDDLDRGQREALADKVRQDTSLSSPGYLSRSEKESANALIDRFVQSGDPGISELAGQPYNIGLWKPDFLKEAGIEAGEQPTQVLVEVAGRFAELKRNITQDEANKLQGAGYDGAFTRGSMGTTPQTVIWNRDALRRVGNTTFEPTAVATTPSAAPASITPLTEEAKQLYSRWNGEYREMMRTFQGETAGKLHPVGKMLQKGGPFESYRLADAEVPSLFVDADPKTIRLGVQRFLAAAPPEAHEALDNAFAFSLRKAAQNPQTGELDLKAYKPWFAKREAALSARPELLEKFNTAAKAQQQLNGIRDDLADSQKTYADALATAEKGATNDHLNARNAFTKSVAGMFMGDDVDKAIGRYFTPGPRRTQNAQALMNLVAGNKAAIEGIQRATIDHIVDTYASGVPISGSSLGSFKAQKLQDFIAANHGVLDTFFPNGLSKNFDALAEDLKRSQMVPNAKLKGGSDTVQLQNAAKAHQVGHGDGFGAVGAGIAVEHIGEALTGLPGAALAVPFVRNWLKGQAEAHQISTNNILDQMILDPKYALEMRAAYPSKTSAGRPSIIRRFGARVMQSAIQAARARDLTGGAQPAQRASGGRLDHRSLSVEDQGRHLADLIEAARKRHYANGGGVRAMTVEEQGAHLADMIEKHRKEICARDEAEVAA